MLSKLAKDMALSFYSSSGEIYDDGDVEVYAYGAELLISSVLQILTVLILGLIIQRRLETVVFLAGFIPLRVFAGGYHAKTHLRCFLGLLFVYAVFLTVLHIIPLEMIVELSLIFTVVSFFPIWIYAPLEDVNRPIGEIQGKKFRKSSLVVYFVQASIIVTLSILGLIPYIILSFACGQLAVTISLLVADIKNRVQKRAA